MRSMGSLQSRQGPSGRDIFGLERELRLDHDEESRSSAKPQPQPRLAYICSLRLYGSIKHKLMVKLMVELMVEGRADISDRYSCGCSRHLASHASVDHHNPFTHTLDYALFVAYFDSPLL